MNVTLTLTTFDVALNGSHDKANEFTAELTLGTAYIKGEDGLTPYIGSNGNWFIGSTDTGVKARGVDGTDGLTPTIGSNGNWFIGTTDTGIKAQGLDGQTPEVLVTEVAGGHKVTIGSREFTVLNGTDGQSPVISTEKDGNTTIIKANGIEIGRVADGHNGSDATATDVQINGSTIVENGVANIKLINSQLYLRSTGELGVNYSTNPESLAKRTVLPLVCSNIDQIVKAAMCDGKGEAWTEAEQLAARARMYVMANTPSGDPMHYLFVQEGAEYNDTVADITKTAPWGEQVLHKSGMWYLNGIGDLTTDEIREIHEVSVTIGVVSNCSGVGRGSRIRTNFFHGKFTSLWGGEGTLSSHAGFMSLCSRLKILNLNTGAYLYQFGYFFCGNCSNLERVLGTLSYNTGAETYKHFVGCGNLKSVHIKSNGPTYTLSDSPLLEPESVVYAIINHNASNFLLTLHPDAYARAIADADVQAALAAHTNVTLQYGE